MLFRLRSPLFLTLIFAAALLLRLGAAVALRDIHAGPSPSFGADPVEFDQLARHLAAGDGYVNESGTPTAFRAPGFPLFLALLYRVVGPHYPIVYVTLCVMGAVACLLTYFIARELLEEKAARWSALLACVYFPHIYFSTLLLSENLFILTLGALLILFLRHLRTRSALMLIAAGVALGACILIRPFALLLLPLFAMVLLVHGARLFSRRIVDVTLLAACCALIVAPWTIRNCHSLGHAVLVASNGGSTFYGGNNDIVAARSRAIGTWVSTRKLPGRDAVDAMPDEPSHDKLEWQLGRQWLREHPSKIPLLMSAKAVRLVLPDVDSRNRKYVALNLAGYTPFMLLMGLGILRCLRMRELRSSKWVVIHGVALATLLTALIFWGSPRFRDANLPVLMIYSALGLCRPSARTDLAA
jgi:4-amino-4-deoxy-L-arabinose transferase-like glycosyltransferase